MLKAFAVALVLSNTTPTLDKQADSAKAPEQNKPVVTERWKPIRF
ncbi:hypothetical protein [Fluctibacter halophilus]|nr:hypothetical protein [Aestuariibacter halophilus]